MSQVFSTTLCFGLLTLVSVTIFLESVHGRPYLIQDIELSNKLEELNQLEKLKEQLIETKEAEMFSAIDGLSSSHPNKREKQSASELEDLASGNTVSKIFLWMPIKDKNIRKRHTSLHCTA